MTAISHSANEFYALYESLSNDEKNTVFSLLKLLSRKKLEKNASKDDEVEKFFKLAETNTEELPRIKPEKNKEITVFDDWIE